MAARATAPQVVMLEVGVPAVTAEVMWAAMLLIMAMVAAVARATMMLHVAKAAEMDSAV